MKKKQHLRTTVITSGPECGAARYYQPWTATEEGLLRKFCGINAAVFSMRALASRAAGYLRSKGFNRTICAVEDHLRIMIRNN